MMQYFPTELASYIGLEGAVLLSVLYGRPPLPSKAVHELMPYLDGPFVEALLGDMAKSGFITGERDGISGWCLSKTGVSLVEACRV